MYSNILQNLQKKIGRQLTRDEYTYCVIRLKKIDFDSFAHYPTELVEKQATNALHTALSTYAPPVNLHTHNMSVINEPGDNGSYGVATGEVNSEDLSNINIASVLSCETIDDLRALIDPSTAYLHYYVSCDSDNRDTTNEDNTNIKKFTWAYIPNSTSAPASCTSVGAIENIIGMRLYQPRVPYVSSMLNSAHRISILVEEFAAQAFTTPSNTFHFLLRPNIVVGQTSIELSTEDFNDGIFMFRDPIRQLSSITVSFANPDVPVIFSAPFNRFLLIFEFICLP